MKTEVSRHAAVRSAINRALDRRRGLRLLVCAFVLSFVCLPSNAQVTELTKQAVAELRAQYPTFKLSSEAQQCVDSKLVDPECELAIRDEMDVFVAKKQLSEDKKQLEFVAKVGRSIDVVVALSQLGMFVDHGVVPNAKADYMAKVQSGPKFDARTREFIEEFLAWRKRNPSPSQNPYRSRLIQLAKSELEIVDAAIPTIADKKYREDFAEFRQMALQIYNGYLGSIR